MTKLKIITIMTLGMLLMGCHNNVDVDKHTIDIGKDSVETEELSRIESDNETKQATKPNKAPTVVNTASPNTEESRISHSVCNSVTHKLLDDKLEISYSGYADSHGYDTTNGLMLFANGIPQIVTHENESDYIISFLMPDLQECKKTFYWNNYENGDEGIAIRYANLMLPDLIITDDPCFVPLDHNLLSDGNPQFLENKRLKQTENIMDLEGEIDYSGEYFIGFEGFAWRTVYNREGLEKFVIKATRDENQCGNYILSFWGDGKPIQVGESMYYRVNLPASEFKKFVFDMDAEQLKSITNFYYILAPEDDSKLKTITKCNTIVFSDKVTNTVLE